MQKKLKQRRFAGARSADSEECAKRVFRKKKLCPRGGAGTWRVHCKQNRLKASIELPVRWAVINDYWRKFDRLEGLWRSVQ